MLWKIYLLTAELLGKRATIVPQELNVIVLAKSLITLTDEAVLVIGERCLVKEVQQVSEVVSGVEGDPSHAVRVLDQVTLAEKTAECLQAYT